MARREFSCAQSLCGAGCRNLERTMRGACFAGVVHHREGASGSKHNYGQDDQQWVLHGDLANAGPRLPLPNYRVSNEPNVNAPGTVAALRFCLIDARAMESGGLH
jgi:hypothetical protein